MGEKDIEKDTTSKSVSVSSSNVNKKCGQRTCSVLAHNKMLLHALKYLSRPVFGVLIGTTYKDKESSNTYVHIMDVIPLQHNFFSSMVVEIAFMQIQDWLNKISKGNNNLRILGVYFANGHSEDVSKNTSAIVVD